MVENRDMKKEFLEMAFRVARPVHFVVRDDTKELILLGMPSNFYILTYRGFLIEPKDLKIDLTPVLEYWDKVGLVRIITHPNFEAIYEWAKEKATPETELAGYYTIPTTGLKVPFLAKKNQWEIQSEDEALELFVPIFNEWSFEENCYAMFTTFIKDKARLKVDKITSPEDVEQLLQQEKARYEEYKAKYPEDMALVEELYEKYKEKWIREVESLK